LNVCVLITRTVEVQAAETSILTADHSLAEWLCLLKITKRFEELIEREHPVNHGMDPRTATARFIAANSTRVAAATTRTVAIAV